MGIDFDPAKDAANTAKHGVSLAMASEMDLSDAVIVPSDRDGETRFVAYGLIEDRLHVLVFSLRGSDIRAISLRKGNRREQRHYTA